MKPNEQFSWMLEQAAYSGRSVRVDVGHRIMPRTHPPKTALNGPQNSLETAPEQTETGHDQHR
jgi:hypothetical protein